MSTDTPRALKDALTEALQAALHNVKGIGIKFGEKDNAVLKRSLDRALNELEKYKDVPPHLMPGLKEVLNSAYSALHGLAAAKGAVILIDGALEALDNAARIGAPGASQDKATYTGAKFDVSPEALLEGQKPVVVVEDIRGATIIHDSPDYSKPPTRREIADRLLDELEQSVPVEGFLPEQKLEEGEIRARLLSLRKLMQEVTGELDYTREEGRRRKASLEQVLTYAHRRLCAYPAPAGIIHLKFILRLAAGLTTLQSPPAPAEVGAALYHATELHHSTDAVKDSPEEEKEPDKERGLYQKWYVTRISDPDGKHENCAHFVLDLEHDRFALPALEEYMYQANKGGYKALARDISRELDKREGYLPHSITWGLAHIPGSTLDQLEDAIRNIGDVAVVKDPDAYVAWREDNLECLRILRGCFAAYAGGDKIDGEQVLNDALSTASAEPEHEHNVMCLPYHSAFREIERRINIYRDDTLEAYNDFGEGVVSKATITAVNTFTAQLIKIITDVAGDTKGYNKGTIEREAHANKGYPKPHLLPTGAHNALVAAREGIKTVLNGVKEANTEDSFSEAFIRDRVMVVLRYNDFDYVREAFTAVERALHLEITGDKRLPIPEGAEERRIATEGLHSARGEEAQLREEAAKTGERISELESWRTFANGRLKEATFIIESKGRTVEALRQDNELLSRENELQAQSIIAYMFVVQRLRAAVRTFLDLYKAQAKAVEQAETGELRTIRPDYADCVMYSQMAGKLLPEIKALAESAVEMGEGELELLDKACPSYKMKTTEGLTEY